MGVRLHPPFYPDRMGSTLANMGSEQLETHPEISQISWEPHGIDAVLIRWNRNDFEGIG